ncbi:Stimulator of interferon protein [Nymphon striatum]|nr:Stimulator of interferon protein [Nymphon striatum]
MYYVGNDHLSKSTEIFLHFLPVLICVIFTYNMISFVINNTHPENHKKTIGHWSAMGYYLGFLKFAIPAGPNSSEPNIAGRMKAFEDKHEQKQRFRIKKLFILVPYSCHTTGDLANFNEDDKQFSSLQCNGELRSRKVDRSGVQERTYKNTVYEICDVENTESQLTQLLCLELDRSYMSYILFNRLSINVKKADTIESFKQLATPLQTLYEMVNNSVTNCSMTASDLNEERTNFVKSLEEVCEEDQEVGSLIEIIEFNDRSEGGERVKLSEVILNRIHQIEHQSTIPVPLLEMQEASA